MKVYFLALVIFVFACGADDSAPVEIPINCAEAGFSVWKEHGKSMYHIYSEDFLEEDGTVRTVGRWYRPGQDRTRLWAVSVDHLDQPRTDVLFQSATSDQIKEDQVAAVAWGRKRTNIVHRQLFDQDLIHTIKSPNYKLTIDPAACQRSEADVDPAL